jgi:internalin A
MPEQNQPMTRQQMLDIFAEQKQLMTRQQLLSIIAQAARKGWTKLDLSGKGITELPNEIGQLANLQKLDLSHNQLTLLPESIGQLTNLQKLDLKANRLISLPDSLGQLTNLQWLNLSGNQLTSLPESLGQFANLQSLSVGSNRLTLMPEWIGRLGKLLRLIFGYNQLTSLPDSIGQLVNLQWLYLNSNQLTSLPASLVRLENLTELRLDDNPFNPALESAYRAGRDTLLTYLRSLEQPVKREELYEAKLVLVGEGGVGKTTLLKALTGREPRAGEPTTHGVSIDIQAMHLHHPEKPGVQIQLNAWDFGGQEVYRVTHQFFFSRRSLYLLVWEPRMGVQQCQVEDWLRLIRLRVGSDARVIIVSTHCRTGERIARIDQPVLMRDFGSMIVGFCEVDSLVDDPATGDKVGLAPLKLMMAQAARRLEQMGMEFNRDWREARDELMELGKTEPHVAYMQFAAVCERHGLDAVSTRTLAVLMHDLGYIVYYGDDERLKDDMVLQPEWLTKAIGFVLEDRQTQAMDGILPDSRLRQVWWLHTFKDEPRYDPALYPFFLRLMEKYDVSYRLEEGHASLVAQHVPQVRPDLPWLPEEDPAPDRRRIGLVCVMEEAPPGLVPWMIVRTHTYAHECHAADGTVHRLHWQKGMFLRNTGHGEAMLELRDREFHLYAEAVWPEYFMNVLKTTLHKLISDNWPGLKDRYYFGVPCRERTDGKPCGGRFNIDALRQFLEEGDETIRCQVCRERQSIVELLYGFEEAGVAEQLRHIQDKLEGLESRVANYVMTILQAIASESKEGPRLFSISPVDGNWRRPFDKQYWLQVWCEGEGHQPPVFDEGVGIYQFTATRDWVRRVAPYANFVAGVLKTVVPMVGPTLNLLYGPKTVENLNLTDSLDLMGKGTSSLLKDIEPSDPLRERQGVLSEVERSGVLALHALLRELDPNHEKLGLWRIPTYTGNYLWLCKRHYEQAQPKIPDKIE